MFLKPEDNQNAIIYFLSWFYSKENKQTAPLPFPSPFFTVADGSEMHKTRVKSHNLKTVNSHVMCHAFQRLSCSLEIKNLNNLLFCFPSSLCKWGCLSNTSLETVLTGYMDIRMNRCYVIIDKNVLNVLIARSLLTDAISQSLVISSIFFPYIQTSVKCAGLVFECLNCELLGFFLSQWSVNWLN